MIQQKIFNFDFEADYSTENFFVSRSNINAYKQILNNENSLNNILLKGPSKSGKTHLGLLWKKNNNGITYSNDDFRNILNQKRNIFYDDLFSNLNEEHLFHLINHCFNNNLKIIICTTKSLSEYDFKIKDLSSRLKSFHFVEIKDPDDQLLNNLLMKLLYDKQIIINNSEVFSFITKRIHRTYLEVYRFVEKIDKLSLEKKRELTIPLIKELL